jgi:hypothetical protein
MTIIEENTELTSESETPAHARKLHAADAQAAGLAEAPPPSGSAKGRPQQARGPPELNGDLLWGGAQVAAFLGVSVQQLYHLVRTKKLPISKLGRKTIIASKKKLQRAIDNLAA